MNRVLSLVTLVLFLCAGAAAAQDNPFLGSWKLNVEKSKMPDGAPASLMRTVEPSGDGYKYTFTGKSSSGADVSYNFTAKYDGKDYPVTGTGMPFGADTIALKSVTTHKYTAVMKKGGKEVARGTGEVSKDGKTTTVKIKGTGAEKATGESVYDKQ